MIKKIYLDVDGVLADFTTSALLYHGIRPEEVNWPAGCDRMGPMLGMTSDEFIKELDDYDFWSNLGVLPNGNLIYNLVAEFCHLHRIPFAICTQYPEGMKDNFIAGRNDWLDRNAFSDGERIYVSSAVGKGPLGEPDALLIDDMDYIVDAFSANGGYIHQPARYWNRFHDLAGPNHLFSSRARLDELALMTSVLNHFHSLEPTA